MKISRQQLIDLIKEAIRSVPGGYCKMHDFSCAAEKTCLTYAPGGPKK